MKNVVKSCVPRDSIIQGTFNPEVFTAALGPVVEYYRSGYSQLDNVYTNAETFFGEATYVTDGLKTTVNNIFQRIAGDMSVPAIQRLETAFGGGKTHTLIACVHIANRGTDISTIVSDIIDSRYLPVPGSVKVVGIAGDELKISQTVAGEIKPYTIWGEMAKQIGGEELYNKVKKDAESYAAPGRDYFEEVIGDKKLLIMFDELAQYASKLQAYNGKSDQVAAFLMALNGYVRYKSGVSIVITLAGSTDAFAKETDKLLGVLNDLTGEKLTQDDVLGIVGTASNNLKSVVMRDATGVTPVQANEISAVLAKRLFKYIDVDNAKKVASAYKDMYVKNQGMLPQEATKVSFEDRMVSYYPFHPTLIDFLNNKLAMAETFQGTRGVLRTLSMVVRSIWKAEKDILLIHVSDIDLHNGIVVDEILGRTGSSDLKQVLAADIGSIETSNIRGGKSNAQLEDEKNRHPDGIALFEDTWKVVFLNSLVGRADGFAANVFGVAEQEAIFQVSTPKLLPSQARMALEKITESAFYLRCEQGKYFAHLEPTINSVLARIRETIEYSKIIGKLKQVAGSLIPAGPVFAVENHVVEPADIRDDYDKPVIGVISFEKDKIDVQEFYKYKSNGAFRVRKNLMMLLVPKNVKIEGVIETGHENIALFGEFLNNNSAEQEKLRAEDLARQVLAINILAENPQQYGVAPSKLQDPDFRNRQSSRPQELKTAVASLYTNFVYHNVDGIVRREIVTGAGESTIALIEKKLVDDGELLLTNDSFNVPQLKSLGDRYFFKSRNTVSCGKLLEDFFNIGSWPVLSNKNILERILREGVTNGLWVVYKTWTDPAQAYPTDIYHSEKPLPMNIDLLTSDLKITTLTFAKSNGWLEHDKPAVEKVKEIITRVLVSNGAATVGVLIEQVKSLLANAEDNQIYECVVDLVMSTSGYALYVGDINQQYKPEDDNYFEAFSIHSHEIGKEDVLISKKEQSERGWLNAASREIGIELDGDRMATQKVVDLVCGLGSSFSRGKAKSDIDSIDIYNLRLPSGGNLRIAFEDAKGQDFKMLSEFLSDLKSKLKVTDDTGVYVEIKNPEDDCEFAKAIKTIK